MAGALSIAALGAWIAMPKAAPSTTPDSMPMVLDRVRSMGELHSASHTFTGVDLVKSQQEPTGLFAFAPGMRPAAALLTGNQASLAWTATVEAGVDLNRAEIVSLPGKVIVRLPEAKVYGAQVDHSRVHQHQRGLFWRDDNIALKGLDEIKAKARRAAEARGIADQAEASAHNTLRKMLEPALAPGIQVEFQTI